MKENSSSNTTVITISIVVIVAILAAVFFVVYNENQKTPAEKAAESIGNTIEDISDAVKEGKGQ